MDTLSYERMYAELLSTCSKLLAVTVLSWQVENRRDGFEYAVSEFVAPWHSAQTVCDLHGGALASASTEEDNSFIAERFLGASSGYMQSPR